MTGHTARGWPYALPTDALIDYPAASLELANKLDAPPFTQFTGFENGWSAGGSLSAGYYVDASGFVRLQGVLSTNNGWSPGVAANILSGLPASLRPSATRVYGTVFQMGNGAWNTNGFVLVTPAGSIQFYQMTGTQTTIMQLPVDVVTWKGGG